MHNGFLDCAARRWRKLGNIYACGAIWLWHAGEAVRLHLPSTHYRQPLDFSEDSLTGAGPSIGSILSLAWKVRGYAMRLPDVEMLEALR